MMKNSQLVLLPSPEMGHLVPAVEFAKLLINRHDRLTITLLLTTPPSNSLDSSLSSFSNHRLHFILLPPHPDPPTHSHSLHPSSLVESRMEYHKPNVRDAVSKLTTDLDSPRLAGFVVDVLCTSMIDVATEFGVPSILFFTYGAAFLGFKLHTVTLNEEENVDTTAFTLEDSRSEFDIPSFQNRVPVSTFPGLSMDKQWKQFFFNHTCRMKKAKAIIVNTFDELESHALRSLSDNDVTVYPVGPILSGEDNNKKVEDGLEVMKWLDHQPPSSVLFLCFGSKGCFQERNQVTEIARALEASGVHFLWSLRKPPADGSRQPPSDYSNLELEQVLPEGFVERARENGRVVGWAPQAQILAHKAVGGFVSHCGWNSILESIYNCVPIATWPQYAEQQLNAFLLVRELKLGVEISLDYRRDVGNVISADRIEKGIREVMEKESEVRKKVKEMSKMCKRALMKGGSSYSHVGRFISDVLNGE